MKTQIQTRIGLAMGLTLALLAGLAPRAEAAGRYWIATSAGNWSDTANWSDSPSGSSGFSVPGSSDTAYFGADASKDGNCAMNATVNVASINIASDYDGTITQGAVDITVGSTGWTQAGGTFNGGSNPIAINGPVALSGGTFKSTSGTLTHNAATWTSNTGTPTFNANGGKVVFYRAHNAAVAVASGNIHFNNVDLQLTGPSGKMDVTGTMYVDGTLAFIHHPSNTNNPNLNSGTIQVGGDLTMAYAKWGNFGVQAGGLIKMAGTGNQTISSAAAGFFPPIEVAKTSGTLILSGIIDNVTKWTWTSGTTLDATGSTLNLYVPYNTSVTLTPGTVAYNNVGINVSGSSTIVTINGTWDVNGNYSPTIRDNYGSCKINTGTFNVAGNLTPTYVSSGWGASTCAIVMDGTGSITATGGSVPCASLTVNTSGTVSLGGNLNLSGLTWTSGSLNLSTYTLAVAGTITTGAGADGLQLAASGVLNSTAAYALTCRSLQLGSDTFAYRNPNYDVSQSYQSIENHTVNFSTFFTGAGTPKTIQVGTRPSVSITATTPDASEQPTQAGVFTVSRGTQTAGDLTVNFTLASGGINATPGAANDYTLSGAWVDGAYSGSVTIPNGAVSATITATPVDDLIYDPDETVIPTLTANANYTVGSPASATVTIHDNETGNVAPFVSAGADQTVLNSALPIVATLNGSVTDDGQPTPVVTKTWSQVSGPGTATFTDINNPGTTVSFNQEGVYVLQLLGDDSALQASDQVTISVYKRQVSVAVQDGAARAQETPTDTATFRVSRPGTYTGEDLVVNYTLGGTAAVGTDYSILPLSGSVIIPQGETYGDIVVTPVWKQDGAKTVELTLTAGPAPYEITGPNSPSCTLAKVGGPNRYWVAATAGNWSDSSKWSDESGGPGSAGVPGNTGVAFFDGNGAGACAINATVDVKGVNIGSGYAGTISQGAVAITVGSTGWTQAGGTFTGSANALTLNGPWSLAGGTFNAGNQTIAVNPAAGSWTYSGGTFAAGSSTVSLSSDNGAITITGSQTFNNLTLNGVYNTHTAQYTVPAGTTLTVGGTLSLLDGGAGNNSGFFLAGTGTIAAQGNITASCLRANNGYVGTVLLLINGAGDQTFTNAGATLANIQINKSSGTLSLAGTHVVGGGYWFTNPYAGSWTYTAGALNAGASTITFVGDNPGLTISGSHTLGNVTFVNVGSTHGNTMTIAAGTTLTVAGTLSFNAASGGSSIPINTGTLNAQGDVSFSLGTACGGTAAFTFTGAANQQVSYAGTPNYCQFSPITVNKTGGALTLATDLSLNNAGQQLVWTSGSLNLSSKTLTVAGTISTGAGAEGLELAAGGKLISSAAYALTCRSLQLGSDTFAYLTPYYDVSQSYQSIQNNTVNFSTFFTGAGAKTIFVNASPSVSITATTPDAYELPSPQAGVFTVSRGSRTDGDLIVNFTLASGGANATPGAAYDYTLSGTGVAWVDGATSGSVTIPSGFTSATITATPVDDVIYDPDETVIPTLTANANYTIGSSANATVTIHDNETGNVAPVVSAGANQTVLNGALPIVATLNGSVTDDGQPTPVLTKTWSQVSVVPPGGTASFTDATDPGTTVSFDQEGVYVLQLRGDDSLLHTDSQVTISAYKRQVSVAVQDGTARATQTPTDTATFRVSRPGTYTGEDLVVNYTLGGTATVGTDYSILPLSGSVIIPQGETYGDIEVTPVYKQDGAKTVVLTLTAGPAQAPYEITGANPPSACTLAKVTGLNRYWVAATPGNWSDSSKWSDESGGPGSAGVPGNTGVAFFDGGGAGACAINATVDVKGVNIGSGYGGTISQGAVAITVGSTGWTQAGGTFTGSANALTLNGPWSLAGGTFNAGNQTISLSPGYGVSGNWTSGGGTFNAGSSTVSLFADNSTITVSGSQTFNNLTMNGVYNTHTATYSVPAGTTLTVGGTLSLLDGDAGNAGFFLAGTGTIAAKGNITASCLRANNGYVGTVLLRIDGAGDQTFTNAGAALANIEINKQSGTLSLAGTYVVGGGSWFGNNYAGSWTYTAGALNAGASTITFYGDNPGLTISGSHTLGNVTFVNVGSTHGNNMTIAAGTTLSVAGTLSFNAASGGSSIPINTGTLSAQGDVSFSMGTACSGTAAFTFTGAATQQVSYAGTPNYCQFSPITVNKTGGAVTLATDLSLGNAGQQLVWTNGAVNLSSNTLTVAGATTIYPGATTLGVTVADATKAGLLVCNGGVTSITNAGLAVNVAATEAQVLGQLYTIVSNANVLAAQFESVTWQGSWKGVVAYTANFGKNVTLSSIGIERGTVFKFR